MSASQWGAWRQLRVYGVLPVSLAPTAPARPAHRGTRRQTAGNTPRQGPHTPQTRYCGHPVLARVMVSMPPAPGPPENCGVVGRLEICPYHVSKAKADAIAP
jgi:hypothetical protein